MKGIERNLTQKDYYRGSKWYKVGNYPLYWRHYILEKERNARMYVNTQTNLTLYTYFNVPDGKSTPVWRIEHSFTTFERESDMELYMLSALVVEYEPL